MTYILSQISKTSTHYRPGPASSAYRYSLAHYAALLLVAVLIISLIRNVLKLSSANEKIKREADVVESLKDKKEEIQKQLEYVQSQDFIEQEARNKLGLAKEGEIIIILPDEESLKKLSPRREEEQELLPEPNWKRWLGLFL